MNYTQTIVRDYLDLTRCNSQPPAGKYDLFATEGGIVAMCYIFNFLQQNCLLNKGDSTALMTPLIEDINKLRDPKFKALLLINPTNPPSYEINKDSRQVALNHTARLSLPQQMRMSLFAAFVVLDTEKKCKKAMLDLIHKRQIVLWGNMQFILPDDSLHAGYYSKIDILVWTGKLYESEFVEYLKETYNPLERLIRLANLNESDYVSIHRMLAEYADA